MTTTTLTDTDLLVIREWCGSDAGTVEPPGGGSIDLSLSSLATRVSYYGSAEAAALAILRERRANFETDPTRQTVDGDYSTDHGANLAALDARIAELERVVGVRGGRTVVVTQLERKDARR